MRRASSGPSGRVPCGGASEQRPCRPDRHLSASSARRPAWPPSTSSTSADHRPCRPPAAAATPGSAPTRSAPRLPDGGAGPALLLDMATSAIAFGKARVARNKGVPVPDGRPDRRHGRPTTDPMPSVDRTGRAAGVRRAQGLGPGRDVRDPGRRAHRRRPDDRARHDEGRRPEQMLLDRRSTRRRSATPAAIGPRSRPSRLDQGLAAGARLRGGAAAGRARGRARAGRERGGHPDRRKSLDRYPRPPRESLGLGAPSSPARGPDADGQRRLRRGRRRASSGSRSPAAGAGRARGDRARSGRAIGTETRSRNSEVIHAGIYYRAGSLKARLCVEGKPFLYALLRGAWRRRIGRCGKLIVATDEAQVAKLEAIRARGARPTACADLRAAGRGRGAGRWSRSSPARRRCWSPTTGIIDSHALMLAYRAMPRTPAPCWRSTARSSGRAVTGDGIELEVGGAEPMQLRCRAAWSTAPACMRRPRAARIAGLRPAACPARYYCQGQLLHPRRPLAVLAADLSGARAGRARRARDGRPRRPGPVRAGRRVGRQHRLRRRSGARRRVLRRGPHATGRACRTAHCCRAMPASGPRSAARRARRGFRRPGPGRRTACRGWSTCSASRAPGYRLLAHRRGGGAQAGLNEAIDPLG